jgi:protoporphyrinogen oxidase
MYFDIIGGGINGLATAYFLTQRQFPYKIRIWERDSTLGGLAGSFVHHQIEVEKFYHHILRSDIDLIKLLETLNIKDLLHWTTPETGSYYFSRPHRLSSPLDILRFKELTLIQRLRFILGTFIAQRHTDWEALDDLAAEQYLKTTYGRDVYELVWLPLLKGKFGQHAGTISAAWIWSKLIDRGKSRSISGREVLGYLEGGFATLFNSLRQKLVSSGVEIHLNKTIKALTLNDKGCITTLHSDVDPIPTNGAVITTQLTDAQSLIASAIPSYRNELEKIHFLGNICLITFSKKSWSNFYWTNIYDKDAPFVGVVEHSRFYPIDKLEHTHVQYISSYMPTDDPRFTMSATELLDYYTPHLSKLFSRFNRSEIIDCAVWKSTSAQPIPTIGYRKLIPPFSTPAHNLYLCTMAQIYPHDRQVSNGIGLANSCSEYIVSKACHSYP